MRAWGHFQRNTSEGFNSFVVPQALVHRLKNAISSSQALDAILIANCKPLAHVGHFGSLPSSEQVSRNLSTKVCGTPRAGEETKTWPFLLLMQFWNPRRRDSVQEQWDTITWVMHPCHQIKFIPLLLLPYATYKLQAILHLYSSLSIGTALVQFMSIPTPVSPKLAKPVQGVMTPTRLVLHCCLIATGPV